MQQFNVVMQSKKVRLWQPWLKAMICHYNNQRDKSLPLALLFSQLILSSCSRRPQTLGLME
jgi:hypothetical protein